MNSNDPSKFGKVAVLMGGNSAEREVSLQTGRAVVAALERKSIDVTAVDWHGHLLEVFDHRAFDRVFIALHGRGGEDGQIQGFLQVVGLPYTGSGILGSALAMDKVRTKQVWQGMDLPTPEYVILQTQDDVVRAFDSLGGPIMVKPSREGSSFGATRVTDPVSARSAFEKASHFDAGVLAERWISGSEYTVGILRDQVLPIIRLETDREFYDYQAKYVDDDTRYICPCGLSRAQEKTYGQLALRAFAALGASGWGRVDMMVDEQGQVWLLEVNTVPGMTSHSLVPMAAKQHGISFDDLVLEILATSL